MSADRQVSLFEPTGAELSSLFVYHFSAFGAAEKRSKIYEVLGFPASSKNAKLLADSCLEHAMQCEMALQFEQLAGLK